MEKNWYQLYCDELLASASFRNHMDKCHDTVRQVVRERKLFSDTPMLSGLGLGIAFSFFAILTISGFTWVKVVGIVGVIGCIIAVLFVNRHLQDRAEDAASEEIFRYICYEAALKEYIHDNERQKTIEQLRKARYTVDLNELRDDLDCYLDELYEDPGYKLPRDHEVRKKVRVLLKLKDL